MADFHGIDYEDAKPLRCDTCGDSIGVYFGDPPDPEKVVARCYHCAAVEEAEIILSETDAS